MEGSIELKQYDGSQILPKDDAILYDMIVGQCGIIKGCELTWLGSNQIHINAGYGIIKGRLFEVADQTIYAKLPASSTTFYGYVVIVLNLENADEPISIATCVGDAAYIEGDWVQDEDLNYINGTWEMPIGEYRATSSGITEFTDMAEKVTTPFVAINDFSELEAAVEEGYLVDANLVRKLTLTFQNKTVRIANWVEDSTYEDYPYRATVSCSGVDANYIPYVNFDVADAISGLFAPVANTASNKVYIYANRIPDSDITIPTIQCIRKVG